MYQRGYHGFLTLPLELQRRYGLNSHLYAGFTLADLTTVIQQLACCKAGKRLKALKLGPPVDGTPDDTSVSCLGVSFLQAPQKACPQLQLLSVWGLGSHDSAPEDSWIWTNLAGDGVRGTCLDE